MRRRPRWLAAQGAHWRAALEHWSAPPFLLLVTYAIVCACRLACHPNFGAAAIPLLVKCEQPAMTLKPIMFHPTEMEHFS